MLAPCRWIAIAVLCCGAPAGSGELTRGLTGQVTDRRGNALRGAAVEIENTRDQAVGSYLTRDDGRYYFHNLSTEIDYTVRAKYKRWWSKEKTLSKFNEKRDAVINLEIPVE